MLMLCLSVVFAFLSLKQKEKQKKFIYALCSSLPFIIISAIRFNVGSDFLARYYDGYIFISKGGYISNYFNKQNMCFFFSKSPNLVCCDFYFH